MARLSTRVPTADTKLRPIFREAAEACRHEARSFAALAPVSLLFRTIFAQLPQSLPL